MKWTDIPHGTITAAEQRLWVAIGDNADVVATRINTDPGFVTRLAGFAVNPPFADKWCTSLNAQWLRAREIMGKNFFGIEEAVQDFGVHPSETQLAALAQVPFTEEVLQSHKDTHILVAVFPLSILDIRGKVDRKLFRSHKDAWYNKQTFAKDKGEVGWQLVRKTPVANSANTIWEDHLVLLGPDEKVPKAQALVYTIIGHYLATGERLFESVCIRSSDIDSDGHHVLVGLFFARGLLVHSYWDSYRFGYLGVASARKFRTSNT